MRPPSVGGEDDGSAKELLATIKNEHCTMLRTFKVFSALRWANWRVLAAPEIRAKSRAVVLAVKASASQGGWHEWHWQSGWEVIDRRRRETGRTEFEEGGKTRRTAADPGESFSSFRSRPGSGVRRLTSTCSPVGAEDV